MTCGVAAGVREWSANPQISVTRGFTHLARPLRAGWTVAPLSRERRPHCQLSRGVLLARDARVVPKYVNRKAVFGPGHTAVRS
jgi:hypothetical protein